MKKKEKNVNHSNTSGFDGFNNLMNTYIEALHENSDDIVQALELLKGKKLSEFNKKVLKGIQKDLKNIDKDLKDIGG